MRRKETIKHTTDLITYIGVEGVHSDLVSEAVGYCLDKILHMYMSGEIECSMGICVGNEKETCWVRDNEGISTKGITIGNFTT